MVAIVVVDLIAGGLENKVHSPPASSHSLPRGHDNLVATFPFGLIQRRIRRPDHVLNIGPVNRQDCDPDRRRDGEGRVLRDDRERPDVPEQFFCPLFSRFQRRTNQND